MNGKETVGPAPMATLPGAHSCYVQLNPLSQKSRQRNGEA